MYIYIPSIVQPLQRSPWGQPTNQSIDPPTNQSTDARHGHVYYKYLAPGVAAAGEEGRHVGGAAEEGGGQEHAVRHFDSIVIH